jgi:hypothetical protein
MGGDDDLVQIWFDRKSREKGFVQLNSRRSKKLEGAEINNF